MSGCMRAFTSALALVAPIFGAATAARAVEQDQLSSKVLYQAVDQLTDYLARDLGELGQHTRKTAIVNYTQSESLPTSIQHYLIKRLERLAGSNDASPVRFVQCMECTTLTAVAEGDEVFIRKGITDEAQLKDVMQKLGIRKYGDVNLAYTGDQLVLQVNVVDDNKMVDWSKEYKTPYKAYDDSPWVLSAGLEVGAYGGGAELPAAKGGRLQVGQRLPGVGAAGLTASFFEAVPGVPQVVSYGAFFSLSHNEAFDRYWSFVRLSYQAELGVTDFNGAQLLHETLGVKTVLGKYYSVGINTKLHQFVQTPTDDTWIANPDGAPVLRNNQALPMLVSLVVGVELL